MNSATYVLLDRDGVINWDSDEYIKSAEEWRPLPRSIDAIALLKQHGFQAAVVTNQSGLARGLFDQNALDSMHQKMQALLTEQGVELAGIYICPHAPDANCACRKPAPGLLLQFSREHHAELEGMYLVGDSWKDLESAWNVKAKPILVKTGKGMRTLNAHPELSELDVPIVEDLYAAVEYILAHSVAKA